MPNEMYIIMAAVGFVGTLGGIAIGFYKAKAESTQMLQKYVTKDDCAKCSTKKEVNEVADDLKAITQDLKQGSKIFNQIKVDMAVIKTKLRIKSDIDELRAMVMSLETSDEKTA